MNENKMTVKQLYNALNPTYAEQGTSLYLRSIYGEGDHIPVRVSLYMLTYGGVQNLPVERCYGYTDGDVVTKDMVADIDLPPQAVLALARPLDDTIEPPQNPYVLIEVVEREINTPIFFEAFEEAQAELCRRVAEAKHEDVEAIELSYREGRDYDDCTSIIKGAAWTEVYGQNMEWKIFRVDGKRWLPEY